MSTSSSQIPQDEELIHFRTIPALPGVVQLSVDNSRRQWTLFHETVTIGAVTAGLGQYTYRRRQRPIAPGTLMLMEPGEVHVTDEVASAGSFRVLFIDAQAMSRFTAGLEFPGGTPHFKSQGSLDPAVFSGVEALHRAIDREDCLATSELFVEALTSILDAGAERPLVLPDPPAPSRLRAVRDRIHDAFEADPEGKFSCVETLASEAGMTVVQLIRAWRRYWGCPVWAYVMRLRLCRAQRLLLTGPADGMRTFADVALAAGYVDLSHMDRAFKRLLGVSPSRFALQAGIQASWSAAQGRRRNASPQRPRSIGLPV